MGVERMTGTPWHIEHLSREEGDPRRHRSRCFYHRKKDNYCSCYRRKCCGSAHCMKYREDEPPEDNTPIIKSSTPEWAPNERVISKKQQPISNGCHVRHKSYGKGTVMNIADDRVTVLFANGEKRELSLSFCVKYELLARI